MNSVGSLSQSIPAHQQTSHTAPEDDGVPIVTIDRGAGKQLRIRWREFKGHHFLDLREWSRRDEHSDWWPTKGKGITIKPRELSDVLKALEAARGLQDRS